MNQKQHEISDKLERLCELWDLLNRSQEYPAYYEEDEIEQWQTEYDQIRKDILDAFK